MALATLSWLGVLLFLPMVLIFWGIIGWCSAGPFGTWAWGLALVATYGTVWPMAGQHWRWSWIAVVVALLALPLARPLATFEAVPDPGFTATDEKTWTMSEVLALRRYETCTALQASSWESWEARPFKIAVAAGVIGGAAMLLATVPFRRVRVADGESRRQDSHAQ